MSATEPLVRHTQWMAAGHRPATADLATVIDLDLAWDPAAPLAVELRFVLDADDPEGVLVWAVSRDLLALGAASWGGDGDVRLQIWPPAPDLVLVHLRDDPTGRWSRFLARRDDLTGFVAATYEVIPRGVEHIDVDAAIEQLLADGGED